MVEERLKPLESIMDERETVEALAGRLLAAADYYIAGLQAVQRGKVVRDLDERHVAYDNARSAIRATPKSESNHG